MASPSREGKALICASFVQLRLIAAMHTVRVHGDTLCTDPFKAEGATKRRCHIDQQRLWGGVSTRLRANVASDEVGVPLSSADYPVRVRFRAGVVGETKRVVHIAMSLPGGGYLGLCEVRLAGPDAELISDLLGMPCMVCTRVLALRSRVADPAELAGPCPEVEP